MSGAPARSDDRLRGNRIWPVPSPRGGVLQKLYAPHSSGPGYWARLALERLARRKTPTTVAARHATERELLRLWRAAGCDVPAELSTELPQLAHPRVNVIEHVPGKLLGRLLADETLPRVERDALLARFAAAWGRRHALAVERRDARLVQEHGTFLHVIVSGERLVTIDLEQAYRPRADVVPLVAREIASYVRALAKGASEERLRADLRALVAAYPRRDLLDAAVREHLANPNPVRRLLWALDRRLRRDRRRTLGKYGSLELLRDVLAA